MDRFDFHFSRMTRRRAELEALPRTCKEAKVMQSLLYYTGKPCVNGHLAARYTNSHSCLACTKRRLAQRESRSNPKNCMTKIDDLKLQVELKALEGGHGNDT